jgi:hypothetical protein
MADSNRRRGNPPTSKQFRIDFEREQRERRQLIQAVTHERAGLSLRRWSNAQQVLLFIVNCDKGLGYFPYIKSIAAACKFSESTVDRAIADVKSLLILSSEPSTTKAGRGANEWLIDFERLATLGVKSADADRHQSDAHRPHSDVDRRQNDADPYKELALTQFSVNSLSTSTIAAEEVEQLVSKLRCKLDIKHAREAVRQAMLNGCSLDQLRGRAQWFYDRQRDWTVDNRGGAAYRGIADATPDLPVHHGWPYRR